MWGAKADRSVNNHSVSDLKAWVGRDAEEEYRKGNRFRVGGFARRKDVGQMIELSFMIQHHT